MSTHKHLDRICCASLIVALILTVLFMNGGYFGIQKASAVTGYEKRLFATSSVHTIDIVMDDWEGFLSTCTNEEYSVCTVVIDGEPFRNVAIRAKGNTSLTQVKAYGNNRYSFKIEFDHYDVSNNYYGLDKLCLNNIIQDNTYMKDYLCYRMMAEIGAASPLCSFVNISVNGETWGLYLAVEGVEEAFLQRNYGADYGTLYKPDSMSMGGGRGNGKDFKMEEWDGGEKGVDSNGTENNGGKGDASEGDGEDAGGNVPGGGEMDGGKPDGAGPGGMPGRGRPDGDWSGGTPGGEKPDGAGPGEVPSGERPDGDWSGGMPGGERPDSSGWSGGMPNGDSSGADSNSMGGKMPEGETSSIEKPEFPGRGGKPGGMGKGSDDVLLKYIDDNIDSYKNIFDNAVVDVTDQDKKRLIESLKGLNSGENPEQVVDVEEVIRYFVVHNFVLNFDSYTGAMIHNYYLYEEDGKMGMIPWDYNLAFGAFEHTSNATELVNDPIDSPVSGGSTEDRPMLAWIFSEEAYTEIYHQYFSQFISDYFDSGKFAEMIDSVKTMIAPYVQDDPTKFCTYEEFETGIDTLKEFCLLRAESVKGQISGAIGSTAETQSEESLIDAGEMDISSMGSMGGRMGK